MLSVWCRSLYASTVKMDRAPEDDEKERILLNMIFPTLNHVYWETLPDRIGPNSFYDGVRWHGLTKGERCL